MPLPDGGKFDDMCIRFDTTPECDEQTEGWICHNNIALYMQIEVISSLLTYYFHLKQMHKSMFLLLFF